MYTKDMIIKVCGLRDGENIRQVRRDGPEHHHSCRKKNTSEINKQNLSISLIFCELVEILPPNTHPR